MADQKLTALTAVTTRAATDLAYIVHDPSGSPVSRKIAISNLLGYSTVYGIDPTGSSDAFSAIDAANDALHAAGGGMLFLPPGTFKVSGTLALYPDVEFIGSGQNVTILKSSSAVPMFEQLSTANESEQAQGRNLRDLTLHGNSTGTIGLNLQRQYYFGIERVYIHSFTSYLMDFQAVLVCTFRECQFGLVTGAVDGGSGATTPTGIRARSHNNGTNTWAPNLVTFDACRFYKITSWAVDWDTGGKINFVNGCNFEFCGTSGDDATGVLRFTNCGYETSFTIRDAWFERCDGFAVVYLGAAAVANARCVMDGVLSGFHGTLKHGVYVVGTGNGHSLYTSGCSFDANSVTNVTLTSSAAIWEKGPTTLGDSVSTGSGVVRTWGN